jgi:1,4-alpha-glucan branching enzyme
MVVAEDSSTFSGVTAPLHAGGLGFQFKWNMGWMNDTLRYMREDPIHRRWHHDKMTFGLVYAFGEHFVLPLSHDEVVHGKGSMLGKMPGDSWQKFANLRAYYGFMWGHPGKKLLFMGQERSRASGITRPCPGSCSIRPRRRAHAGWRSQRALPRAQRLHRRRGGGPRLLSDQAELSVLAWLRRDETGAMVLVVCNFTPVPRQGFRLGVPAGPPAWREALNTDALRYGGSGMDHAAKALAPQPVAAQGRVPSLQLTLAPLSTLFLVPA